MKKRILFVDDEAMVLQGLQRMLRSMRAEWEMEFVECAEAALCLLAQKPFDVIVSDMRMPRMNGAELLAEVMKRHPTTVRLILSGYADKDLILKCVGSAHQYLAKPCDAESLKATIARASNVEDSLRNERLKSLVCQMNRLPSIPSLYMQVVEKSSRADASVEEIGDIIGRDIGMTAQVLKLTNSAFFGLSRQFSSAQEAVAYLGLDTIKSLVLSIHAFSQFEKAETGSFKIEPLWSHSMQVASSAKRISKLEGQEAKAMEEAFTAGLLHDIGKLVLAVNLPKEYAEAIRLAHSGLELPAAEHQVFGANHADVGGYLIGLWGLPVPVVEAVALHHSPSRATQPAFTALTSVHAANVLEWERPNAANGSPAPRLDDHYLGLVGVSSRLSAWRQALAEPLTFMTTEILFVDDDSEILAGFQRSLRKEFKIDTAEGGAAALALIRSRSPYAVVMSDMRMPGMNGVEFLMELEKLSPDTIRIMLTGNADQKTARDAVNQGHIFRFLTKPCPPEELVFALRAGLKQYHLVTAERDVLEKTLNGSALMLSDILATHDAHSFGKSQRLRDYIKTFAGHLQLKQTWDLELAAMLSQIGCVTIPQAVLARARAGVPLAATEADMVKRIPQIGHDLLSHIPRLESVAAVVLYQNKNFDGTGFPFDKIAGEDIPIGARILRALEDLVAHESAKTSKAKALELMAQCHGRYDPRVLESVAAVFDICWASSTPAETQSRPVGIKTLRIGWTLAMDARTRDGMMLVPAGTQISPMLMQKLRNFAELGELEEPMQVTNALDGSCGKIDG